MSSGTSKSKITAGFVSVLFASVLAGTKLWVGLSQGSMAVIASGLDSCLDFLSSSINFYALYISAQPPDSEHRYGHGKAEAIAGLFQSIIFTASCIWLFYQSFVSGLGSHSFQPELSSVFVMTISMILTGILVLYQRTVIKRTNSVLIEADSLHYLSDLLSNFLILLSLGIEFYTGWTWLDPLIGGFIALYLLSGFLKVFKKSLNILMDRDFSDDYRETILRIISEHHPRVLGYHDLRARSAGERKFLEFHLEFPKTYTLEEVHKILESIMDEMKEEFPYTEILIHPDPVDVEGSTRTLLDKQSPQFY
ncbi:cation transporter [Leptospira semungkisensis]|uniref:Cation transporter n=1 Tax=Leptospira semungkisensis TaxID=2484985 RepID=A0A4R9G6V5_9LEPT|nr:cation diffusion facilitator family transporter [Leptospira semungkisensis]TGK06945.1 cation transporter [Leptospira semungkisensis]